VSDPWLSGLVACALTADAEAVRQALHARGLKTRSVPAGRAKGAWTCVTDRGTLAVVVSGKGAEAARQAASFWMPRARWLVLSGAGPGTGSAAPGQVVLDGDHDLAVLAANGDKAPHATTTAKVATVSEPTPLGEAARATLGNAGYAAWDAHIDTWREAAAAMAGATLVCHGITTNAPDVDPDLHSEIPEGATGRPWWRTALGYLHPRTRRAQREADRSHQQATQAAARCAVAALLGPA
jgi:hypothetical protein